MRSCSSPPDAVARPIADAAPEDERDGDEPDQRGDHPLGHQPSTAGRGRAGRGLRLHQAAAVALSVAAAGCVGSAASSSAPLVMAGIVADQLGSALSKG